MATGNERSRVLEAFRAVGVIALPLKCPVLKRGVENFVTTSVKNGFQVLGVWPCVYLRVSVLWPWLCPLFTLACSTGF